MQSREGYGYAFGGVSLPRGAWHGFGNVKPTRRSWSNWWLFMRTRSVNQAVRMCRYWQLCVYRQQWLYIGPGDKHGPPLRRIQVRKSISKLERRSVAVAIPTQPSISVIWTSPVPRAFCLHSLTSRAPFFGGRLLSSPQHLFSASPPNQQCALS